ncbi:hypothetical protein Anapl_10412 [Anas platyrhynchos]|uniref:Uncharacterized protein n=1 Tax=Anas platyrhynchos TaxID=8839 RepID=R0K6J5_ANAPL|nr:hypothetical protein Anapl_10412 [Anas platyrhynchos]
MVASNKAPGLVFGLCCTLNFTRAFFRMLTGYSFKLDPFLTVVQKQLCWHDAKVGMSGSTHTAETGTGAAEILVEPQPWLPNLPPLLTEVRGQVCGIAFLEELAVEKTQFPSTAFREFNALKALEQKPQFCNLLFEMQELLNMERKKEKKVVEKSFLPPLIFVLVWKDVDVTVPETYLVLNRFLICDYVKDTVYLDTAVVMSNFQYSKEMIYAQVGLLILTLNGTWYNKEQMCRNDSRQAGTGKVVSLKEPWDKCSTLDTH